MKAFFSRERGMSFLELRAAMQEQFGKSISAVRVSVGLVTNFADVYHLLRFAQTLLDRTTDDVGAAASEPKHAWTIRDVT